MLQCYYLLLRLSNLHDDFGASDTCNPEQCSVVAWESTAQSPRVIQSTTSMHQRATVEAVWWQQLRPSQCWANIRCVVINVVVPRGNVEQSWCGVGDILQTAWSACRCMRQDGKMVALKRKLHRFKLDNWQQLCKALDLELWQYTQDTQSNLVSRSETCHKVYAPIPRLA
eukprot:20192-Heterococcus_DN1.PRE.2